MPKEETIELRHIRNVIGEKDDLPSFDPMSSIITRLKAMMLKIVGIPELIHKSGVSDIDKTLTLEAGENDVGALYTDGRKLYVGLKTSPGKIVKIDIDSFVREQVVTLATNNDNVTSITSDGTYLYATHDITGATEAGVSKIHIDSFTITSELSLNLNSTSPTYILNDGNFIYVLTWDDGLITKISIDTFTVIGTLDVSLGPEQMTLNERFIYVVNNDGDIIKIDIDSFTITSTLTIASEYFTAITSDGNYLYVGNFVIGGGNTKIYKININTFTQEDVLVITDGDYTYSLISDGTSLYTTTTSSGILTYIDIFSFTVNKRINTTVSSSGIIVTDGLHLYIGTNTSPGTVLRKYLISTISLLNEQVSNIHRINVSTVTTGTYSHSNDTNKNTVLEFTAATQDIELRLDTTNITQLTTITEEEKVDGTNYRIITQKTYPIDFDTNTKSIAFSFPQSNASYKVTFQSGTAEGSAKNVPYVYRTIPKS